MSRWVMIAAALVCGASALVASGQSAGPGNFAAAGSGDHLWIVKRSERGTSGLRLFHHDTGMGGAYYRPFLPLNEFPDRFFSWESKAWFVYAMTSPGGRDVRREVYSIEATFDERFGGYQSSPIDHLKKEQPLPSVGRLVDMVGTPRGPVALLIPEQRADATVQGRPGSLSEQPTLEQPQLLRLEGTQWVEVSLPEGGTFHPDSQITTFGRRGLGFAIITSRFGSDGAGRAYFRGTDGAWRSYDIDLGGRPVLEALPVGEQVAIVQGDAESGDWIVSYVRGSGLLRMATLPDPGRRRVVTSLAGRLQYLKLDADGTVSMQRMAPLSGTLSTWESLSLQPVPPRAIWQTVIISALILLAIYLAVVIKPGPGPAVQLPPKHAALPFSMRLIALLFDMAPGGILAVLVFDCRVVDLLHHPLLGGAPEKMLPFALMLAVTMAHSLPSELLKSTTFGKALLGAEVLGIDGKRPNAKQVLIRNLYKLAILLIPLLAVLMFRSPNLQGIPEIKSETVVAHEIDEPAGT